MEEKNHICPVCKKEIECTEEGCNYSETFKMCLYCLAKKQDAIT